MTHFNVIINNSLLDTVTYKYDYYFNDGKSLTSISNKLKLDANINRTTTYYIKNASTVTDIKNNKTTLLTWFQQNTFFSRMNILRLCFCILCLFPPPKFDSVAAATRK